MNDDKILEQIKRLGVLEDRLRMMRSYMERAWFILDPPTHSQPECPPELRLEDLRHVMRELDALIPYPSRMEREREESHPPARGVSRPHPSGRERPWERERSSNGTRSSHSNGTNGTHGSEAPLRVEREVLMYPES